MTKTRPRHSISRARLLAGLAVLPLCASLHASPPAARPVALEEDAKAIVLSNGLVRAELDRASGNLVRLWLGERQVLSNPSYLDWHTGGSQRLARPAVSIPADPRANGGAKAEVVFAQQGRGEIDVALHYVMLPGERALRMFAVFSHPADRREFRMAQARYVTRLSDKLFETVSVDAERFRELPPFDTPVEALGPKESLRFTAGPWQGGITDKYHYFTDAGGHFVHGWTGKDSKLGCWIVYGSTEDQNGGPTRQHNTAHWQRILLKILACSHYGAPNTVAPAGRVWEKVYGPWMLYLNEGDAPAALRADAERQAAAERAAWPAAWIEHPAFAGAAERGGVRGRLVVRDPQAPGASAAGAWVGLAEPSPDWQQQALNYQHWVRADAQGRFSIPAARAGGYTLYAFVGGVLGEFRRAGIVVTAGGASDLGELVWTPGRHGRQLWEIGTADRTAKEFRHGDDHRHWGLWLKYPREFPEDVVFTIGQSDWRRDWNYAQVTRAGTDGRHRGTTWRVLFDGDEAAAKAGGDAVLRLAFAGTHGAVLRVLVNGREAAVLRDFPGDNAMIRAGIHGQYSARDVRFPSGWLRAGRNEIALEQQEGGAPAKYIMYDYLRLEVP
ncbi:polysaccharide lyase family protein [Termitidicoccus mucosus]